MADTTISGLQPLPSVTSSLLLPASDGASTGKVTIGNINSLAPVQSVFGRTGNVTLQSSDVTGALGYTPYNSTNPAGYISQGVVTLATGNFPSNGGFINYSAYTVNVGSLANYKLVKIILRNIGFSAANTRICFGGLNVGPYICHNNTTSSVGVWVNCTLDLIGGTLLSVSENNNSIIDTGTGYVFLKSHSYTQSSTQIVFYTTANTTFFDGGSYVIMGLR